MRFCDKYSQNIDEDTRECGVRRNKSHCILNCSCQDVTKRGVKLSIHSRNNCLIIFCIEHDDKFIILSPIIIRGVVWYFQLIRYHLTFGSACYYRFVSFDKCCVQTAASSCGLIDDSMANIKR